jgi:hypothetical protein
MMRSAQPAVRTPPHPGKTHLVVNVVHGSRSAGVPCATASIVDAPIVGVWGINS